jgi:fatty-acyl-CoA synthase
MMSGLPLIISDTSTFRIRPAVWFEMFRLLNGRTGYSAAPSSAYAIAARQLRAARERFDLTSWRYALNGSELVDVDAFRAFLAAGVEHGLAGVAATCGYGLAEATLAISIARGGLRSEAVSRGRLETLAHAATSDCVLPGGVVELASVGAPLDGVEAAIARDADFCADGEIGELLVRGPSIIAEYVEAESRAAITDSQGWCPTGDIAYRRDGELFICGRASDMIVVNGRNVYPEVLERAVGAVHGVRTGNVIAFGVMGRNREDIVIVCEVREQQSGIASVVRSIVRDEADITPADVVLLAPGTIPKTTSGKLRRNACRELYLSGRL